MHPDGYFHLSRDTHQKELVQMGNNMPMLELSDVWRGSMIIAACVLMVLGIK